MTLRIPALLALTALMAGCDGNPLNNVPEEVEEEVPVPAPAPGTDGGISRDGLPPGTNTPSRSREIVRYEAQDGDGGGYVTGVTYDAASDSFLVDNLAFDGDNRYRRGTAVAQLGPFAVYESAALFTGPTSATPIPQMEHRMLFGVSPSGQTEFAVVRTGAYVQYGFGGFIYQRRGGVVLPTGGQAAYSGDYAALRDFKGRGGLEYAAGRMDVAIDFDDFNSGAGVRGYVYDRAIYDLDGNDITGDVLAALGTKTGVPQAALPTLVFTVGPGVLDVNGELVGDLTSSTERATGGLETFETGKYYGIIGGQNASEIVGVVVVTADDPRYSGVTVRETGGFILARQP
jgi:hypothetical protein